MTELEKTTADAAKEAIIHTLATICDDPQKYWLLGNGTESFNKLTKAYSLLKGIDQEAAAERYKPQKHRWDAFIARKKLTEDVIKKMLEESGIDLAKLLQYRANYGAYFLADIAAKIEQATDES